MGDLADKLSTGQRLAAAAWGCVLSLAGFFPAYIGVIFGVGTPIEDGIWTLVISIPALALGLSPWVAAGFAFYAAGWGNPSAAAVSLRIALIAAVLIGIFGAVAAIP